jgi:hypothetical protein
MLKVKMIALIRQLRNEGIDVKIIRCECGRECVIPKGGGGIRSGTLFQVYSARYSTTEWKS